MAAMVPDIPGVRNVLFQYGSHYQIIKTLRAKRGAAILKEAPND
jgi:hypothetical protein